MGPMGRKRNARVQAASIDEVLSQVEKEAEYFDEDLDVFEEEDDAYDPSDKVDVVDMENLAEYRKKSQKQRTRDTYASGLKTIKKILKDNDRSRAMESDLTASDAAYFMRLLHDALVAGKLEYAYNSVRGFHNALADVWKTQGLSNKESLMVEGGRYLADLMDYEPYRVLKIAVLRGIEDSDRPANEDPAKGTAADCYTTDQFDKLMKRGGVDVRAARNQWFWHAMMAFCHQSLARNDDVLLVRFAHMMPPDRRTDVGPSTFWVFHFILRGNKTGKDNRAKYLSIARGKCIYKAPLDAIRRIGNWGGEVVTEVYATFAPKEALLALAGYTVGVDVPPKEAYWDQRYEIGFEDQAMEDALRHHVYPWFKDFSDQVDACITSKQSPRNCHAMLVRLAEVLIQGCHLSGSRASDAFNARAFISRPTSGAHEKMSRVPEGCGSFQGKTVLYDQTPWEARAAPPRAPEGDLRYASKISARRAGVSSMSATVPQPNGSAKWTQQELLQYKPTASYFSDLTTLHQAWDLYTVGKPITLAPLADLELAWEEKKPSPVRNLLSKPLTASPLQPSPFGTGLSTVVRQFAVQPGEQPHPHSPETPNLEFLASLQELRLSKMSDDELKAHAKTLQLTSSFQIFSKVYKKEGGAARSKLKVTETTAQWKQLQADDFDKVQRFEATALFLNTYLKTVKAKLKARGLEDVTDKHKRAADNRTSRAASELTKASARTSSLGGVPFQGTPPRSSSLGGVPYQGTKIRRLDLDQS
eukprot:gene24924-10575_t